MKNDMLIEATESDFGYNRIGERNTCDHQQLVGKDA
jgi:hypothetical protein